MISDFHHVAFRCKNAKETVAFYRDILGLEFTLAIAEDKVPSTGENNPYMHIFLQVGQAHLAFFELPNSPEMGTDLNTPNWVQHIALKVKKNEKLLQIKNYLESLGHNVLGPVNHGIFHSIYFHDPSGHRLELVVDQELTYKGESANKVLKKLADEMLTEWSLTGEPPKHAQWLHSTLDS